MPLEKLENRKTSRGVTIIDGDMNKGWNPLKPLLEKPISHLLAKTYVSFQIYLHNQIMNYVYGYKQD